MALFSVAFLGSTPIGAPIVGWISQHLGPRAGLAVGGVAALAAAAFAIAGIQRTRRAREVVHPDVSAAAEAA
jgi:predicted MFS family arabinose efflux permease